MSDQPNNDYVSRYKAKIAQWEAEIDKLKARAVEMTADARIELQDTITDFESDTASQRRTLDEIQRAGDDAREALCERFEEGWERTRAAWEVAKARFG